MEPDNVFLPEMQWTGYLCPLISLAIPLCLPAEETEEIFFDLMKAPHKYSEELQEEFIRTSAKRI